MSHTPGPWEVGNHDKNDQRMVRAQHIEVCTCWHHSVAAIEQEMEANARLIAAAPDLLAALEYACEAEWNGVHEAPWVPKAMAAIKKAKGEA